MSNKRIAASSTYTLMAVESKHGEAPESGAVYRELDLASYSDAGASSESVTRNVMAKGRRPRKGAITSRSVGFGYNIETTLINVVTQMAAFMWRIPKEKGTNFPILQGKKDVPTVNKVTAVAADSVTFAQNAPEGFKLGTIVVVQDGSNDRRPQLVGGATGTKITLAPLGKDSKPLIPNAKPDASTRVVSVGSMFADESKIVGFADRAEVTLKSNASMPDYEVGEWLFFGCSNSKFDNVEPFYGRVAKTAAGADSTLVITLDSTTRPIPTSTGTAPRLTVYHGIYLPDGEDEISLRHLRNLGKDADGKYMEELFRGCLASELSINMGERALSTLDFTFIGSDVNYSRETTEIVTRVPLVTPYDVDPVNTSTDVLMQRVKLNKEGVMNPAEVHGLVKDLNVSLNNNLTEITGNGIIGNAGANAGDVGVTGTIDAYFIDIDVLQASKCNCTGSLESIMARKNQGFVVDIPALTFATDGVNIEDGNDAVRINVTQTGFESKLGPVMSYTHFDYLPNAAMPYDQDDCEC